MAAKEFTPEMKTRLQSLIQKQQSNEGVKTSKNLTRHFNCQILISTTIGTWSEGLSHDLVFL